MIPLKARGASFLHSIVLLVRFSCAFDCSVPPIYVDIHARGVHQLSTFEYGSFFGLGSPAQNFSLWPSLEHNETTVADLNICNDNTNASCGNRTGGLFAKEDSQSFKSTPQYQSLDLAASSNITLGTDTVHLYTHFFESDPAMGTNVETVPISILNSLPTSNSSAPFSYLALGPSSSLLRSLYNTGKISSRSFGLYVGEVAFPSTSSSLNSISDVPWTANGSVTFGGYDSARLKNPVGSFQLQQPPNGLNAFKVSVADVRLISDSDTDLPDTSLLKASPDKANATFGAYVSTSSIPIVIPSQVLDNLKDRTKDLSTTTNVTISFILNTASGPQPFQVFTTPASIETSFAAPSDGSAPFTLGLPFLSSNYLAVDYDAGSFYLAPAVPSAPFIAQTTLCPQTTPKPYGKPNVHSFSKQGLIGAVLGGSIGVIAALTLSYCFIGRWLRRRKREKLYGGKGKEIELDEEEMTGLTEHRLRFWRKR